MITKLHKFIVGILIVGAMMSPFWAKAVTIEELQKQLQSLNTQLNQLQSSSNTLAACVGVTFSKSLQIGSNGNDVKCLQQILNQDSLTQVAQSGVGSVGKETTLFGSLTKLAVIRFQEKYASEVLLPFGFTRGTGIVGPATRAKLNVIKAGSPQSSLPIATQQPFNTAQNTKSQSELTVDAIAKASPGVVSIIVTKEVAEYQVVFENQFTNGPFEIRIPVSRPTGRTVTQRVGAGSGFIVTADGYIITNKHVVADEKANYMVTLASGSQVPARVIHKEAENDLAIIKIEGNGYTALALGDSSALKVGQPIIAIGNALGEYSNSVSLGIISGLNRTIRASDKNGNVATLTDIIQTDAAINPGNSGGPLLDLNAHAVGINVAMVEGSSNISFALPINPAKEMVKRVLGI